MSRVLALISAALAGSALSAQECPRFGLQAGLNQPQAELKDAVYDKSGFNIGIHMTVSLRGGHALRPRLDYLEFPKASYIGGGADSQITNVSLGLDYLYFPAGRPQGLYLTAGAAAVEWKMATELNILGHMISRNAVTTKLGLTAGIGYQFNRTVGAELRYLASRAWDGSYGGTANGNFNTTQVGVTFQF